MHRKSLFSFALLSIVACGASTPPAHSADQDARDSHVDPIKAEATASTSNPDAAPSSTLHRADVHRVVAKGLGAFLSRVSLDDHPAQTPDGKFVGFRIAALQGNSWKGVDLKPGDIVTKVNGFPIERPEQALEVFQSLDVASELRVGVERDGVPRELRYAIVDP